MGDDKKKVKVVSSNSSRFVMMLAGAVILLSGFVLGVLCEKMVGVGVRDEMARGPEGMRWAVNEGEHEGHGEHGVGRDVQVEGFMLEDVDREFGGPEVIVERLRGELDLSSDQVVVVKELIGKGLHRLHEIHVQLGPELEGVHEGLSKELKAVLDAEQYKKWMGHFEMMKKYHLRLKEKYGNLPMEEIRIGKPGQFMIKGELRGGGDHGDGLHLKIGKDVIEEVELDVEGHRE